MMEDIRIAWLVPTAEFGAYWPPVLNELEKVFKKVIFYTGCVWPRYDPGAPGASAIKVVGRTRFVPLKKTEKGYSHGFHLVSPFIIWHLLTSRPHVIFASGFYMWTMLALLLKRLGKWKVVLVYEGSSPNVDYHDSIFRLALRRVMAKRADAYLSNSHRGKDYLVEMIGVHTHDVFVRPYIVPEAKALLSHNIGPTTKTPASQHPAFLYVGQIINRKGIKRLLDACIILQNQGYSNYYVTIVGDGPQRSRLQSFTHDHGLKKQINWIPWVEYGSLGSYYKAADAFIFPTFEDTWGMVLLEAMAFNKPVLCSKWAGASEMVIEGENGYVFDPHDPRALADAMRRFIDYPAIIPAMGIKSCRLISQHTPRAVAKFITKLASSVLDEEKHV